MKIKIIEEQVIKTLAYPPGYPAARLDQEREDETLKVAAECPPTCDGKHEDGPTQVDHEVFGGPPLKYRTFDPKTKSGLHKAFNPKEDNHWAQTNRQSEYAVPVAVVNVLAEVLGRQFFISIPLFKWTKAKSWKNSKCEEVKLTEAEIDSEIAKQVKAQLAQATPKRVIEA